MTRSARRASVFAVLVVLVAAGSALAGAHFDPGASYTGKTCRTSNVKGTTCVYKFRASSNGATLKFVGTTVITGWGCHGGGGEALLGGRHDGADALPVIQVKPNGALYGGAGKGDTEVSVTGHLASSGKTATVTFHLTNEGCHTSAVTLAAH